LSLRATNRRSADGTKRWYYAGYGVNIELPKPVPVQRGTNNTVLIQIVSKPTKAEDVALSYRIVPCVGKIDGESCTWPLSADDGKAKARPRPSP